MRTITVTGTGKLSVKPDTICITLTLESLDKSYDASMEKAANALDRLRDSLAAEGFGAEDIRTSDFYVSTEYEYEFPANGRREEKFKGYKCRQVMKCEFPLDTARLGRVISAVSASGADPSISVAFTAENTQELSEKLLELAAKDARRKAEVLCNASGAKLGALVSVKYGHNELQPFSPTNYCMDRELMSAKVTGAAAEIVPDDITLSDNAVLEWEIE